MAKRKKEKTMSTRLPTDANDSAIQALRLKPNCAHVISSSGSSARNSTPFDDETRVVSIYASEDVYINFGGASVTADTSDHFFPKGVYYDIAIGAEASARYTHIAVRQVSAGGSVYISEKF